jgi:signal transduction histidine kinase
VVFTEDISARKAAERELEASATQMQTLAARLMHVQDDERRRIARMLHETTAQDLAALKMLLARLGRTSGALSEDDRSLLDGSVELAERAMTEVRTLSYLLHPPSLDESGLVSAIRWYAQGFSDRSGIAIDLDLPADYERLSQDVEIALFRVIQEALINIHRHAQSATATISLRVGGECLTLDIQDCGVGMPADQVSRSMSAAGAVGVGIPGMRERLKQLGASFEIRSDAQGTLVRAVLPLPVGGR